MPSSDKARILLDSSSSSRGGGQPAAAGGAAHGASGGGDEDQNAKKVPMRTIMSNTIDAKQDMNLVHSSTSTSGGDAVPDSGPARRLVLDVTKINHHSTCVGDRSNVAMSYLSLPSTKDKQKLVKAKGDNQQLLVHVGQQHTSGDEKNVADYGDGIVPPLHSTNRCDHYGESDSDDEPQQDGREQDTTPHAHAVFPLHKQDCAIETTSHKLFKSVTNCSWTDKAKKGTTSGPSCERETDTRRIEITPALLDKSIKKQSGRTEGQSSENGIEKRKKRKLYGTDNGDGDQPAADLKFVSSTFKSDISSNVNSAVGINSGRRGDPRMHKAVSIRLTNPSLTLLEALIEGGFKFPHHDFLSSSGKSDRDILDEDGVQLCQRKNQLSRRLRLIRKKTKGQYQGSESTNFLDKTNYDALHQHNFHSNTTSMITNPVVQHTSKMNTDIILDAPTKGMEQLQQQQYLSGIFPLVTLSNSSPFTRSSSSAGFAYPSQQQFVANAPNTTNTNLIDLIQKNQLLQSNTKEVLLNLMRNQGTNNGTTNLLEVLGSILPVNEQIFRGPNSALMSTPYEFLNNTEKKAALQHCFNQSAIMDRTDNTNMSKNRDILTSTSETFDNIHNRDRGCLTDAIVANTDEKLCHIMPQTNQAPFGTPYKMNNNISSDYSYPSLGFFKPVGENDVRFISSKLGGNQSELQGMTQNHFIKSSDDKVANCIVGQLAFEEKLTLAVELFMKLRKGLIMECLQNAGLIQDEVITNNEFLIQLFEEKLLAFHNPNI